MRIHQKKSKEAAMRGAINALNRHLKAAKRKPLLLMLSGGSALELLAGINMRNIGRHVTITVLDERFSSDPAVNNFSQLTATEFYKKAEKKGIDYIDTRIRSGDTQKILANRFERRLNKWLRSNPKGEVIVTQGIGEDGHTAGIFPHPEAPERFFRLFDREGVSIASYNATRKKTEYPLRITVTLPFLREEVGYSVAYASSAGKRRALRSLSAKRGSLTKTPARVMHEMRSIDLFTDQ